MSKKFGNKNQGQGRSAYHGGANNDRYSSSMRDAFKKAETNSGPRPQKKVLQIEVTDEFLTKHTDEKTPFIAHGYAVWVNSINKVICMEESNVGKKNVPYYKFDYTLGGGYVNIVENGKDGYMYFRTRQFQDFLSKFGIDKIQKGDPNGEYHLREGVNKLWQNNYEVITDGELTELANSELNIADDPVASMKYANAYIKVEGATFVLFKQRSLRLDSGSINHITQLVTNGDVFSVVPLLEKQLELLEEPVVVTTDCGCGDGCDTPGECECNSGVDTPPLAEAN